MKRRPLRIHRNSLIRTWWLRCDHCLKSFPHGTWRGAMECAAVHAERHR